MSSLGGDRGGRAVDPLLTANVYAAGHLDALLAQSIVPFWRGVRERFPDADCRLWTMRYGRGGEHLKIRVHAPPELEPELRASLTEYLDGFLDALAADPESIERKPTTQLAPIDAEDRTSELHPDRTWTWTQYGRSHVSFGGEPLVDDDLYADRFADCLAAGCERVLEGFANAELPLGLGQRQRFLLSALLEGLAALELTNEEAARYLTYHRDWLIRYPLLKSGAGPEKAGEIVDRLHARSTQMGSMIDALRDALSGAPGLADAGNPWTKSLRALALYVRQFADNPDYQLDPFTDGPLFPSIFKVFHGLANQLGLKMLDEAFAHHLLRQAASDVRPLAQADTVALVPPSETVAAP